jgi:hypothetical protein
MWSETSSTAMGSLGLEYPATRTKLLIIGNGTGRGWPEPIGRAKAAIEASKQNSKGQQAALPSAPARAIVGSFGCNGWRKAMARHGTTAAAGDLPRIPISSDVE